VESPAKERLTGALILVAALVIIVPELLSGPRPRVGGSADAEAPADAGPPLRTYTLELGSANAARSGDQSTLVPQTPVPATVASQPAPQAAAPLALRPLPQPVVPPMATRPPPIIAAKPPSVIATRPPPPAVAAAGGWWVQLGSFSSRENAGRLAQKLRAAGFAMEVSPVRSGGKELYRVRAGPVATREAATSLQARLGTSGHKATLVAP
jgi:DedD protein